nr:hypothetical protein [Tanacetum cinerariifolium]
MGWSMIVSIGDFNAMDEQAVRGILKEQFDGFTSQLAALTLELQTTKAALAGFNLEGDTAEWYRWMTRNNLITSWDGFLKSVQNRFGPSKYEDPRLAIQRELLVSKPTSLGDGFALARVTEARFADNGSTLAVNQTPTLLPLAIKWISPTDRQERLNKGLCFNCDNKWVRGHKCSDKFILLTIDEDGKSPRSDALAEEDEALESGDISILNSLGHVSPRSLQLWGTVGAGEVHVLIDNGSTHNFVRPDVVERMCLLLTATKAFKVYIGSDETLLYESACAQVPIKLQGFSMDVNLYVLPMQGPDVVLGIQWLQKLGKVTHDYAHHTMEFTLANKTYSLQGYESLRMKLISLHRMQALLETNDVYGIYELHNLSAEWHINGVESHATSTGHSEIDQLLIQ